MSSAVERGAIDRVPCADVTGKGDDAAAAASLVPDRFGETTVHATERANDSATNANANREDATRIMLHVHQNGVGICGVYTFEVAETKVAQVVEFARQNQHPLQCTMEKE